MTLSDLRRNALGHVRDAACLHSVQGICIYCEPAMFTATLREWEEFRVRRAVEREQVMLQLAAGRAYRRPLPDRTREASYSHRARRKKYLQAAEELSMKSGSGN